MSGNGKQHLGAALHAHSHFSLLAGCDSPGQLLASAVQAGYAAVHLADLNAMYGLVPFCQQAREVGIKPIPGVELQVESEPRAGSHGRAEPNRLSLVAATREGYRNLCRLTSKRRLSPESFDLLVDVGACGEGLIVLCDRADWLAPLAERLTPGQLYAELTPGESTAHRRRLRRLYAAARDAGVPVAAGLDCWFVDPSDHDLHRVVTDIRLLPQGRPPRQSDYRSPERRLWSAAEAEAFFVRCPEAIAGANAVVDAVADDVLELGTFHFPACKVPRGQTAFSHLHRLCQRGLRRRYRPVRPVAVTRLAEELAVIEKLGFADYFLFVHEIVAFAREAGIPVDVRGSGASSLVSYVLGFTQVCPIEHELYFARFLHEGRTDCPDIDIDLCWRRRDEVIDFCYRRWGGERVAMICTHNTMRARGAFADTAKVMGLTADQAHSLSRHIPEGIARYMQRDWRELAEARRNLPADDPHFRRILAMAGRLEGAPRHLGIHCGGLVIAPRPLTDYLPLQWATKGIVVTQYEMNAVEAIGLVKMDLLGNRALSEIAEIRGRVSNDECRMSSEEERGRAGYSTLDIRHSTLDAIDPEDPATAALLSAGDTLGVFQAESPGMRHLCRQLRVSSREEMTIALTVIRPGPAGGGMKAAYIARHLGRETPVYPHPRLRELLGRTHGVMLYQEDTMRVAVALAGFSPSEADMLRKAVSKKRSPERMAELRDRFLAKAAGDTPDLSPEAASAIWDNIANFASYSFCRAHACVYGRIAWQTAFAKAHMPAAFYAAVFNNHMGMYPMRVHVGDAIRRGLRITAPHVNESDADSIATGADGIRLGLNFVRSLSGGAIGQLVAGRPFASLSDLRCRANLAEPELVNLIRCGACDGLGPHRQAMLAELKLESPVGELLASPMSSVERRVLNEKGGTLTDGPVAADLALDTRHSPLVTRFPWTRPFTELEKLQAEIDVLGLFLSRHPMDLVKCDAVGAGELDRHVGKRVAVAGILDATRTVKTTRGELMRFVTLEDATGLAECTFFPQAYAKFGHLFYHVGPFRVEGLVEDDDGAVTLTADAAEPLLDQSPLRWNGEEETHSPAGGEG